MGIEENQMTEDEIEINRLKKEFKEKYLPNLEEIAQKEPDNLEVHQRLEVAYDGLGMFNKAIEECEKIIEMGEIYNKTKGGPFKGMITAQYVQNIPSYYKQRTDLNPDEILEGIINTFKKLIKKKSKNATLQYILGMCYEEKEMYENALEEYKKTLELFNDHSLTHYVINPISPSTIEVEQDILRLQGFILYKNGEYDKAIKEWEKIMNSKFRDGWWVRGDKIKEFMEKAHRNIKNSK